MNVFVVIFIRIEIDKNSIVLLLLCVEESQLFVHAVGRFVYECLFLCVCVCIYIYARKVINTISSRNKQSVGYWNHFKTVKTGYIVSLVS